MRLTLMPQREHVANIGERGAARRRRSGYVWGLVAFVVAVALVGLHAPRSTRLLLVAPIGLAITGLLQAREKT